MLLTGLCCPDPNDAPFLVWVNFVGYCINGLLSRLSCAQMSVQQYLLGLT